MLAYLACPVVAPGRTLSERGDAPVDGSEANALEFAQRDDLNSPKRAERNYPFFPSLYLSAGRESIATSLNFSHSFATCGSAERSAGWTLSQFRALLPPPRSSSTTSLFFFVFFHPFLATTRPPTRFRTSSWKLVFHRLCSRGHHSHRLRRLRLLRRRRRGPRRSSRDALLAHFRRRRRRRLHFPRFSISSVVGFSRLLVGPRRTGIFLLRVRTSPRETVRDRNDFCCKNV